MQMHPKCLVGQHSKSFQSAKHFLREGQNAISSKPERITFHWIFLFPSFLLGPIYTNLIEQISSTYGATISKSPF
jgi:hypothetical protein